MDIKTSPQYYTCEQLEQMVNEEFGRLEGIMESSKISFKFDPDIAADIILKAKQI